MILDRRFDVVDGKIKSKSRVILIYNEGQIAIILDERLGKDNNFYYRLLAQNKIIYCYVDKSKLDSLLDCGKIAYNEYVE